MLHSVRNESRRKEGEQKDRNFSPLFGPPALFEPQSVGAQPSPDLERTDRGPAGLHGPGDRGDRPTGPRTLAVRVGVAPRARPPVSHQHFPRLSDHTHPQSVTTLVSTSAELSSAL